MQKRTKRLVALLMALVMMCSMMGAALPAMAAEETDESDETSSIDTSEAVTELTKMGDQLVDGAGLVYGEPPRSARRLRAAARTGVCPTYQEAYDGMMALQATYPEGTPWTNFLPYGRDGTLGDAYWWKGGSVKGASGGVGCAAFVFILSDAVFGNLPARTIDNGGFQYEDIKVGDILRINSSHFVIVLQKSAAGVTVAEGNYNKSIHWGRAISKENVMAANFIVTRYPESFVPPDDTDAEEVTESGTEGNLSWTLTKGGTLTISGSGLMPDFTPDQLPSWSAHNDAINAIVIEPGVTSIGDYAFYQSKALGVYISEGVTKIGNGAFYKAALVAATIPSTVKSIGNDAFCMCPNLASASVAEGVEVIGERAFQGCTNLGFIDFPASITAVGAGAFASCKAMTSVRFKPSDHTVTIGNNLFSQCWHLTDVTLPLKADRISAGMFESCSSLCSIYIPADVTEIGEMAFTQCYYLQADGIYFGGSEATWNAIGGQSVLVTLQPYTVKVTFDVEFEDPFAKDPNDPGDLTADPTDPPADDPCKNGHVGTPDENGNCSVCGKPMEAPATPTPEPTSTPEETPTPAPTDTPTPEPTQSPTPLPSQTPEPAQHQHAWDVRWTYSGGYHWHECTAQGCTITNNAEKSGYGACVFGGWVIDTYATASTNGSRHRDCTICTNRQYETIPATGISTTPRPTNRPTGTPRPIARPTTKPTARPTTTPKPPIATPVPSLAPTQEPDKPTTVITTDPETGATIETTKRTDGSSTVITKQKNGIVVTEETSSKGETKTEIKLPTSIVEAAQRDRLPVRLPIKALPVADTAREASAMTVHTGSIANTKVELPVDNPTTSTIIVIVNADGTTTTIKAAAVTDDSIVAMLPDNAEVKVIDNRKDFNDVLEETWYTQAVTFAAARGLFAGTTATTFAPDEPMTRAMLMTVLARFDNVETNGGETWYAKSVEWAVRQKISDGTRPNDKVTREQLVTMIWRYICPPSSSGTPLKHDDAKQISGYAEEAMRWAVENGIVSGVGNNRLDPKGFATRAQVAQILKNLINKITLEAIR